MQRKDNKRTGAGGGGGGAFWQDLIVLSRKHHCCKRRAAGQILWATRKRRSGEEEGMTGSAVSDKNRKGISHYLVFLPRSRLRASNNKRLRTRAPLQDHVQSAALRTIWRLVAQRTFTCDHFAGRLSDAEALTPSRILVCLSLCSTVYSLKNEIHSQIYFMSHFL